MSEEPIGDVQFNAEFAARHHPPTTRTVIRNLFQQGNENYFTCIYKCILFISILLYALFFQKKNIFSCKVICLNIGEKSSRCAKLLCFFFYLHVRINFSPHKLNLNLAIIINLYNAMRAAAALTNL